MKMVWAVFRPDKVEVVARQLKSIAVGGCTISLCVAMESNGSSTSR